MPSSDLRIGIVGPCKSGKSVLRTNLEAAGYTNIRHIAQEHSFAPQMWRQIGKPDVLIFLDVSFEETLARGKLNWRRADYDEQYRRLAHAHENADLIVDTSVAPPEQVLQTVLNFLAQ